MILQLSIPSSEQRPHRTAPSGGGEWLEEIRSYWAGREARRAEEAAEVLGCVQRALAEAASGLEGAKITAPK